jgi:hypothetical protein
MQIKMTREYGFVWFLPVYISLKMNETDFMSNNISCSAEQLRSALAGHFALSYEIFGSDSDVIASNKTIRQWKREYQMYRNISSIAPSDYAPYVYDAYWVYAKVLIELIKSGKS